MWLVLVREIRCKSAVVKSGIPGVDFALNPYTGCEHGCVYCYASFMIRFRRRHEPWGRFVDAKVNFPEVLRTECRRVRKGEIMLSSVTDPYQPAEAEYRITRECLLILDGLQESWSGACTLPGVGAAPGDGFAEATGMPLVSILTKSDLVVRDADVLCRMRSVQVGMTITAADDRISRLFEPRAPSSSRRLRALETLARKGVHTWAFAAPLIPYYSDGAVSMGRLFSRMHDAGVKKILVDRMNMYPACVGGVLQACRDETRAVRRIEWARRDPVHYEAELRTSIAEAQAGCDCPVEVVF